MTTCNEKHLDTTKFDLYCPQCGEDCEVLVEGYCQDCTDNNYNELFTHRIEYVYWNGMSEEEKISRIIDKTKFYVRWGYV